MQLSGSDGTAGHCRAWLRPRSWAARRKAGTPAFRPRSGVRAEGCRRAEAGLGMGPVIATAARLLCRALTLPTEYLRVESQIHKRKMPGRRTDREGCSRPARVFANACKPHLRLMMPIARRRPGASPRRAWSAPRGRTRRPAMEAYAPASREGPEGPEAAGCELQ